MNNNIKDQLQKYFGTINLYKTTNATNQGDIAIDHTILSGLFVIY